MKTDWQVLSNVIAVITPLLLVIVTYARTWSRFEIITQQLTLAVSKLSDAIEGLQSQQRDILQRISKVETMNEVLDNRLSSLEDRFNSL